MRVVAVSSRAEHGIGKTRRETIRLIAGLGVEGDAHLGETVQHRSRVARDPKQPNLRQVHLVPSELLRELGLEVRPGDAIEIDVPQGEHQRLEPV